MTTEKRKNIDYSGSAVKLCNEPTMKDYLIELDRLQKQLTVLQEQADALVPEYLKSAITTTSKNIAEQTKGIRDSIDTFGSYQDLDNSWYAVKQLKRSKSYLAEPFEMKYPQYAPAVIVKTVDTAKLNGLIKGGLVNEAQLEADGVLKVSESYAYIIKV
jgi:hypothetical protein